jgi:hypothetical protein
MRNDQSTASLSRPQLIDHSLDLRRLWPRCLGPQQLQGIQVLSLDRLFASFDHHSAFHPHLDAFADWDVGTLRDEAGSERCIACTENLVIERLVERQQLAIESPQRKSEDSPPSRSGFSWPCPAPPIHERAWPRRERAIAPTTRSSPAP